MEPEHFVRPKLALGAVSMLTAFPCSGPRFMDKDAMTSH
jgi:hypothetical protein